MFSIQNNKGILDRHTFIPNNYPKCAALFLCCRDYIRTIPLQIDFQTVQWNSLSSYKTQAYNWKDIHIYGHTATGDRFLYNKTPTGVNEDAEL